MWSFYFFKILISYECHILAEILVFPSQITSSKQARCFSYVAPACHLARALTTTPPHPALKERTSGFPHADQKSTLHVLSQIRPGIPMHPGIGYICPMASSRALDREDLIYEEECLAVDLALCPWPWPYISHHPTPSLTV